MPHPLYIIAGFLPSIVWLLFYLRKDSHPESNSMIIKVFLLGMAVAAPVVFIEKGFFSLTEKLALPTLALILANVFIGISLTEEFFKFLVVRLAIFRSSELDEPPDILLYMIIAALGFAASENILLLYHNHPLLKLPGDVISLVAIRFIGATFLHALCSGVMGFFLALSVLEIRKKTRFILLGLFASTALHGLYDFSIITVEDPYLRFVIPILILLSLAAFVSLYFQRLKRIRSICRIK